MSDNDNEDHSDSHIIKLRGLPWNVSSQDILDFLKDIEVLRGESGVHLITSPRDGRPNGEAFVECASENDYNSAFDYHKKSMGHRYIEIFGAKLAEFDYIMKKQNIVQHDTFVKLRGLPYTVSRDDIEKFFEGLELRSDKDSIQIMMDNRGRATGEAYVQFISPADTEKALKKNREKIGHRYIEIFRSTSAEVRRNNYFSRPGPYNRNDRGGSSRRNGDGGMKGGRDGWNMDDNGNGNVGAFGGGGFGGNGGGGGGGGFGNDSCGNNNGGFNNFGGGGGGGGNNGTFNSGGGGFSFGSNGGGSGGFNRDDSFGGNSGNSFGGGNGGGAGNFNNRPNFDRYSSDNNGSIQGGWNTSGGAGGTSDHCVHLRGMPYDCDEKDIVKFFAPLHVLYCNVIYARGRHSGEADAFFKTANDANEAMNHHKEKMGNRYIELFSKDSRMNKRF